MIRDQEACISRMSLLVWRPVVGWEGIYDVSNEGHVRRMKPSTGTFVGRCLNPRLPVNPSYGYYTVVLSHSGRKHNRLIHQLVAESFLGPRPDGHEVNHKDGDKRNNHIGNLEYVTRSQNTKHAHDLGLISPAGARRVLDAVKACGCEHCLALMEKGAKTALKISPAVEQLKKGA